MTNKTILNEFHRKLGARMVDFGGWDMPLHYGSQIDEHHAVRAHCGMFDVSHMCALDVAGVEATPFLEKLIANNVKKLAISGKALYSAMLNEQGGVIDDLIVYFIDEAHYRVVINASTSEKDIAWMNACAKSWNSKVTITPRRDLAMIAVQGPEAKAIVWKAYPEWQPATQNLKAFYSTTVGDYFIATTGYTGEAGFEITLPENKAAELWQRLLNVGVTPIGLAARDTLRLEAGMNLYGQDMDEQTSPFDAGLAWTVDLTNNREFVGSPALRKQPQKFQFLGLILLDKGVLRAHQEIETDAGKGMTTSGTFSPTLQQSIALARLPLETKVDDIVHVLIRGKALRARVVKPCFVRNGKAIV